MTSQSPRIYTYKITFEEVPYYYYGVHKEKRFDEEYWGSPVTHKWCWELYTPKKQILELFDCTDEGWLKSLDVECKLIQPVYLIDKWCLNEHCGGKISLESKRKSGQYCVQNKLGIHSFTQEERRQVGINCYKNGIGIHSQTIEEKRQYGKRAYELKRGVHALTMEQRIENGKKGGKIGGIKGGKLGGKIVGQRNKENKTGICGLTKEQRIEFGKLYGSVGGKAVSAQKWICLETGHISNAGGLARYQKAKGIDTTKRERLE
jgi:hypothetical protein